MHHTAFRGFAVALLLASTLTGCAHDHATGPVVKSIDIEGNQQVSDKAIKGRIATSASSWIPFTKKKHFDANVWTTDLERIQRYYQARGFYQAQILGSDVEDVGENEVRIVVRVHEGEPTRLARVCIKGIESLPKDQRQHVMDQVPFKPGEIFHEEQWTGLKDNLVSALKSFGYAEAKASGDAKVDLATHQAFVDVTLDPGIRYHPGQVSVKVSQGSNVEPWRVKEQVHEALQDQKWWTDEARHEAQQRVFNLGVFGAADVKALPGNPQTQQVPIQVSVTQAPLRDIGVGIGVGIEQLRQEGHVRATWTHRDFLGGMRRLTLTAMAGWAFIPSAVSVVRGNAVTHSGPIADLRAELEQPRLWSPNFRLRTQLEIIKDLQPAYSYYGGNARIAVPYRPRTWLTVEPSYNIEIYRLSSGTATLTEGAPTILFGCDQTCILSYLEERIAVDRRDDPQEPRSGYYLALALQQGGGPLGGSFDYLRFVPEARVYKSFLREKLLTFAARVKVGTLIPLAGATDLESPIVARFYSGGDQMRGFSTQRLSPLQVEPKTSPSGPFNGDTVPIGGNGLFEASFESRYHLTNALVVAGFLDTGFVTTEHVPWRLSYFTKNLLYAVGGGIRYITPVGPVRLDLAYRLPFGPPLPVYGQESGLNFQQSSGCFGIGHTSPNRGGAPEGVCSIHISVGEAF